MQQDIQKLNNGPTATAHIVLAISSFWSCMDLGFEIGFGTIGLILYVITGLLGAILYSSGCGGHMSYRVYSNLWLWSLSLGLPSISSRLYAASDFSSEVTIFHFFPPCLFMIFNMFYKRTQFRVLEVIQFMYLLAVLYISILNMNYYGFALVTSYSISYYAIGFTGTIQSMPAKDLLSFSLAFSNFFTVRTLQGVC